MSTEQASMSNDSREAYTGNHKWAEGETALPETEISPVRNNNVRGDGVEQPAANTKSSQMVRAWRAGPGCKGCGKVERNVKELGRPQHLLQNPRAGSFQQRKKEEVKGKSSWGVRSTHSTQRMNKTFTGGRS